MARFNIFRKNKNVVRNHEGEIAYALRPHLELYNLVAASFMDNRFYESNESQMKRLVKAIGKVEPDYVCKLAVYARNDMYLRSIPVVLVVELVKYMKKKGVEQSLIRKTVARVIRRPDEITEMLAYYQHTNKRTDTKKLNKLSRQLQKGIADSFNGFDEYQFAKYDRKGEVTMKDALFLTHPKAKDEAQQGIFDKIVSGNLQVPYTWETELSAKGNKKEVWMELIDSKRLGYMALLRNLRNILQAELPDEYLQKVAETIASWKNVRRSRQLPFRFFAAYREIAGRHDSGILVEALEQALHASVENLEFFNDQRVLLAADVSGSMMMPLSQRSAVQCYDVGLLLSMLLKLKAGNNVTTGIFGDSWKVKNLPRNNVLGNMALLKKIAGEVGYSTNGHKVLEWANGHSKGFDKIVFFTDCEIYSSDWTGNFRTEWKKYRKKFPNCRMVLFNLAGYGSTPVNVNEDGVFMISGWSERVFDMLAAMENGAKVVNQINKIEI